MSARTHWLGAGVFTLGVALLALGRWLRPVPHHCGDETCEEAHP